MCYEFVHDCQSPLIIEMASLLPSNKYFLICIGDINYLYCNDAMAVAAIKSIFKRQNIKLHTLPVDEMISVIDFPGMATYQTFHGSRTLLSKLREKIGALPVGNC